LFCRQDAWRPGAEHVTCGRIGFVGAVPIAIEGVIVAVDRPLVEGMRIATGNMILVRMGLHDPPPNVQQPQFGRV
jgi:hypothetical protein